MYLHLVKFNDSAITLTWFKISHMEFATTSLKKLFFFIRKHNFSNIFLLISLKKFLKKKQ